MPAPKLTTNGFYVMGSGVFVKRAQKVLLRGQEAVDGIEFEVHREDSRSYNVRIRGGFMVIDEFVELLRILAPESTEAAIPEINVMSSARLARLQLLESERSKPVVPVFYNEAYAELRELRARARGGNTLTNAERIELSQLRTERDLALQDAPIERPPQPEGGR